jgi:syntaxin-binding protein 1
VRIQNALPFLTVSPVPLRYKIKSALGGTEEKVAILSDDDQIWTEVRHMHMKEAIDRLMQDFNSFTQEHAGFRNK